MLEYKWLSSFYKHPNLSNADIIDKLCSIDIIPENRQTIIELLCKLVVMPPLVQFKVTIGDCAWSRYLKKSSKTYSTMHTALKFIQENKVCQAAFLAYEQEPSVRWFFETVHELGTDNRVPYLHALLRNLTRQAGVKYDISTCDGVVGLLKDEKIINYLNTNIASNNLKAIAGATNTIVGLYDFILDYSEQNVIPNLDLIKKSDVGYDLGGGYATPDISRLLNKEFICADLTAPNSAKLSMISSDKNNKNIPNRTEYHKLLQNQKHMVFDVFKNDFPTDYKKYSVVSFGFLTSTVTSQSKADNNPNNTYATLIAGVEKIVNLAIEGKDVYSYLLSRASRRLYSNVVIQFSIVNHRFEWVKTHQAVFSNFAPFHNARATIPNEGFFRGLKNGTFKK
jgi:hypothetical protein